MAEPSHLSMFALEVQLYLADRYNLTAAETAIVFAEAARGFDRLHVDAWRGGRPSGGRDGRSR